MIKNHFFNLLISEPFSKITCKGIFNDVYVRYIFYILTPIIINIGYLICKGCPYTILFVPVFIFFYFAWFTLSLHKKYTTVGLNVQYMLLQRLMVLFIFISSLFFINVLCLGLFEKSFFDIYHNFIVFSVITMEDYFIFCSSGAGGNGSNTSGPSGSSNTPGNGGGNNNPNLIHDNSDRRSRSSSSNSSVYSDEVNAEDSTRVRDIKFSRFIYDVEWEKRRGRLNSSVFEASNLNPYNWPRSDSELTRRLSSELEARIIHCHSERKELFKAGTPVINPFTFTLNDLGIDRLHPLRSSFNNILFPGLLPSDSSVVDGVVYSPGIGVDRLKAIRLGR